jgi:hypothetical protein
MHIKPLTLALAGLAGSLALAGCDLDVPDLNNPGLDQLQTAPQRLDISTAASGLLVGNRQAKATTVGMVNQLGILGREAFDFDPSDSRFVAELLEGPLIKNSPFGGIFWAANYANIKLGNIMLHALDKVAEDDDHVAAGTGMTPAQKNGVRGFVHTIQAHDLWVVIMTHDSTGAPIDVDRDVDAPLAPFVSKTDVYKEIARLLDAAVGANELAGAGMAFSFTLPPGYAGFNTPPNFIKFNRALRARVAVYLKDYSGALTALAASFLDDDPANAAKTGFFTTGVTYSFSTTAGDTTNGLTSPVIYAHPKLETDAQKQTDGKTLDARFVAKTTAALDSMGKPAPGNTKIDTALSSLIKFKLYTAPTSTVPMIRNEELILLKAEALWFQTPSDPVGAMAELNLVRQNSGKLAVAPLATSDADFITALLYERRYSLMYEGGHRWIDLRRFGIDLPKDADKNSRNLHYPVPQAECDARGGSAAVPQCMIASTDPGPAT